MLTIRQQIENALKLNFSDEQWEVIINNDGAKSIVSCAGSGKTTTMVARILYMEMELGIKPYNILTLTFSRKAADDIEKRYIEVKKRMKGTKYVPVFGTFHSFYLNLIKDMDEYNGVGVVDYGKYQYMLTSVLGQGNGRKTDIIRKILEYKSYCVNNKYDIRNESLRVRDLKVSHSTIMAVINRYEDLKAENNEIDFDDMQTIIYDKLIRDEDEELVEKLRGMYTHILVDEFQDISGLQYDILDRVAEEVGHDNVTVIGDDDQCIYAFRGSDPKIIQDFEYYIPKAKKFMLSVNYRCPQNIIEFVAPSIYKNKGRIDKVLQASKEGGEVNFLSTAKMDLLVERIREDFRLNKSVAVLTRTNIRRGLLADMLHRKGVNVDIGSSSYTLLNRNVTSTILRTIRMVRESKNDLFRKYYFTIVPFLNAGIAKKYKDDGVMWVSDVLTGRLNVGNAESLIKEMLESEDASEMVEIANQLLYGMFERGYRNGYYVKSEVKEEIEYLKELSQGKTYLEFEDDLKVNQKSILTKSKGKDTVKFVTLHSVKGLEYDSVYLYDMNDKEMFFEYYDEWMNRARAERSRYKEYVMKMFNEGRFTEGELDMVESERRLFYVGCTRAKEKLTIVIDPNKESTIVTECILNKGKVIVPLVPTIPFKKHVESDTLEEKPKGVKVKVQKSRVDGLIETLFNEIKGTKNVEDGQVTQEVTRSMKLDVLENLI